MSGLKDPDQAHFNRLIRYRLGGLGVLAEFADVGRCHLSSMLGGDTARGVFTWAKVRRQVTSVEWSFLEKCSAWNSFRQAEAETADIVLRTPRCDTPGQSLIQVACMDCGCALKTKRCERHDGHLSHGLCVKHWSARLAALGLSGAEIARQVAEQAAKDRADPAVTLLGDWAEVTPADLFTLTV